MESPKMQLNPLNTILVIGLIGAAFGVGALWQRSEKLSQQLAAGQEPSPLANQPGEVAGQAAVKKEVSVDDDPVIGDPNAPITIIEFSDFQCPYCAQFAQGSFLQLKEAYINTGKARLVFRDLPLTQIGHLNAQKAAEAAACAADQDKFLEYHDKLFETQGAWAEEENPTETFKSYANEIGLSGDFTTCLDGGEKTAEVQNDAATAQSLGINGTPTFIIGKGDTVAFDQTPTRTDPFFYLEGKRVGVAGAQAFEVFKEIIETLL